MIDEINRLSPFGFHPPMVQLYSMLQLTELTKQYTAGFRLGPISVSVPKGRTVAVFGRNGAGKSTMFGLITGNHDRTTGDVFINGAKMSPDAVALKRTTGYLPQESDLPAWVTPRELLTWAAKLHGLPESSVGENLDYWDATSWASRPLAACSHGMQKRIGLALATMHHPDLLILDEAFNALDILHTRALEMLIKSRAAEGKTTLVSTHTPLLAAAICDDAWILQSGSLEVLSEWPNLGLADRGQLIEQRFFGAEGTP